MAAYNNHPLPTPPGEEQEPPVFYPGNDNQISTQYQQSYLAQAQGSSRYHQQEQYAPQPDYGQQQAIAPSQHYMQQQPSGPHRQYSHDPQQQQQQQQRGYPQQHNRQQQQTPSRPVPQERPSTQSRRSRGFSFRSDRSKDLQETHAEKEAKRLHSKADPTLAMSEMEPSVVAVGVRSSLASVRDIEHRDLTGQVITEPDKSNPTRWRFERPLDTIQSFNDAIETGYAREDSKRMSMAGPGMPDRFNPRTSMMSSRDYNRHSYYGNRPHTTMQGHEYDQQQDEYFGSRQPGQGYSNMNQNAWSSGPFPRRGLPNRMMSEPQFRGPRPHPPPNVYPGSGNQQSRETVASGSGSGLSGEQNGYQTDPTSDNSSIERKQSPPQPMNDYGIGFSQAGGQAPAFTLGIRSPPNADPSRGSRYDYNGTPPVPQKDAGGRNTMMRKPAPSPSNQPSQRPAAVEKRKSWFGRHFSKNN